MLDLTPHLITIYAAEESVSEFWNLFLRSPCPPGEGAGSRVGGKGENMPSGWTEADSHAPVCLLCSKESDFKAAASVP